MGTKVKGLLKGLRYISQIFDDEKEQEMQIGFPTDVKHVAHIGWDGPSVGSPSWMNEFRSAPLSTTVGGGTENGDVNINHSGGMTMRSAPQRGATEGSVPRRSRRNQSAGAIEETPEGSRRRRPKSDSSASVSNGGSEPLSGELPAIPKQARRRKTKGGSGGSSRPKAAAASSCSEPDAGVRSGEQLPPPAITAGEEKL